MALEQPLILRMRTLALLLSVASTLGTGGCDRSTASPKAVGPAASSAAALVVSEADLAKSRLGSASREIAISGSIESRSHAQLRAKVDGELVHIADQEGAAVRAGEVVARFDTTKLQAVLAQRQAQLAAAVADVGVAKRALEAQRRLVADGFVAQITLDNFEAAYEAKRATQLVAQSDVVLAQRNLEDAVVRSPLDGIVFRASVKRGEFVRQNAELLYVVDPRKQEVVATVSATDRPAIAVGMPARLSVAGPSRTVDATVTRISPMAEPGTRSYQVYLSIKNGQPDVQPGMFAIGSIALSAMPATLVPLSVLRQDQAGAFVLAVERGRLARKSVNVERQDLIAREAWLRDSLPPELALLVAHRLGVAGQAITIASRTRP